MNKSKGFYIVYSPKSRELQTDRAVSLLVSDLTIDKYKVIYSLKNQLSALQTTPFF